MAKSKVAKQTSRVGKLGSGLRGRLIATAQSKPKTWFEKLEASSPKRAVEIKSLCDEWAAGADDLRTAYPSRYSFAKAIAAESRVSSQTVLAQLSQWGIECR